MRDVSAMRRLVYRRTHGPDIIAEAATSESDVSWRASAWSPPASRDQETAMDVQPGGQMNR
jgi:hypothetical protein